MFSRWQGIERNLNMTRGCIRTNFKGKTALHPVVLCCYTSATPNSESYAGMIRQGLRLTLFKHLAQHQDWEGRIKDGSPIKLPCRLKGPFLIEVPLGAFVARKVWKLIRPPRNNLQKAIILSQLKVYVSERKSLNRRASWNTSCLLWRL